MSWLHYLLEANIYLAVFYLLYFILLDKETHYKLNRIYLLSASVIAFIIPVVQIGLLRSSEINAQAITTYNNIAVTYQTKTAVYVENFIWQDSLIYAYLLGAVVMFSLFIFKIFRLLTLIRASGNLSKGKYKIIQLEDSNTAFSFFNYLFIGNKVSGNDTIIRHELVHIKQKHSFDIVFLELIKIINWFNPFIYLLQQSLKTVHEYMADEQTVAFENDALTYSSFLLSNAYGASGSSITHSFFNYNLLKKRIIMLNKKRSGNLARLKYLVALPAFAALLCTSTLGFSKTYGWIDVAPAKPVLEKSAPTKLVLENKALKNDTVYSVVETGPEFRGGMKALSSYYAKNIQYPESARKHKIEGRVIVSFVVEKDGSISDVKLRRGISPDIDREALRVVGSFPKWKPGAQGKKNVRTSYSIPVPFKL